VIPLLERQKTAHALDREANEMDRHVYYQSQNLSISHSISTQPSLSLFLELGGCHEELDGHAVQPHSRLIAVLLGFCKKIFGLKIYSFSMLVGV
jgi:hypothetical protein